MGEFNENFGKFRQNVLSGQSKRILYGTSKKRGVVFLSAKKIFYASGNPLDAIH